MRDEEWLREPVVVPVLLALSVAECEGNAECVACAEADILLECVEEPVVLSEGEVVEDREKVADGEIEVVAEPERLARPLMDADSVAEVVTLADERPECVPDGETDPLRESVADALPNREPVAVTESDTDAELLGCALGDAAAEEEEVTDGDIDPLLESVADTLPEREPVAETVSDTEAEPLACGLEDAAAEEEPELLVVALSDAVPDGETDMLREAVAEPVPDGVGMEGKAEGEEEPLGYALGDTAAEEEAVPDGETDAL